MEKYNYREEMINDIIDYINDAYPDVRDYDYLYDELWSEDCITGNGTYGYDSVENCEEYLCHNWDLLIEAAREFNVTQQLDLRSRDARWYDGLIRCYLFSETLTEALERLRDKNHD